MGTICRLYSSSTSFFHALVCAITSILFVKVEKLKAQIGFKSAQGALLGKLAKTRPGHSDSKPLHFSLT